MTTTNTTDQLTAAMAAVAQAKNAREQRRCRETTAELLRAQQVLCNLLGAEDHYAEMYVAVLGTSDEALVKNLILATTGEA